MAKLLYIQASPRGGRSKSIAVADTFVDVCKEKHRCDAVEVVNVFEADYNVAIVDGDIFSRVPYIYCSHNRSDLGDSCLTRDAGADPMERMSNILDGLADGEQALFVPGMHDVVEHPGSDAAVLCGHCCTICERLKPFAAVLSGRGWSIGYDRHSAGIEQGGVVGRRDPRRRRETCAQLFLERTDRRFPLGR